MIDINFINQYNDNPDYEFVIKDIIKIAYEYLKLNKDYIINIILVDNDYIKSLNKKFRKIDKVTDVLSFENKDMEDELGDVFISVEKVSEQAKAYKHNFNRELAFLTLHGLLHCLGYNHEDEAKEATMFSLQKAILKTSKYKR
ncbi:MAG: rRNA maturation RNase YbeY [bacterium]